MLYHFVVNSEIIFFSKFTSMIVNDHYSSVRGPKRFSMRTLFMRSSRLYLQQFEVFYRIIWGSNFSALKWKLPYFSLHAVKLKLGHFWREVVWGVIKIHIFWTPIYSSGSKEIISSPRKIRYQDMPITTNKSNTRREPSSLACFW